MHIQQRLLISEAFSPSAPIDRKALFSGRIQQVTTIISAVCQKGQHALIYGERGVGKTSLAYVLHDFLSNGGQNTFRTAKVNCESTSTYTSVWRHVFRQFSVQRLAASAGFKSSAKITSVRMEEAVAEQAGPEDVRFLLEQLSTPSIIIIDELDRATSPTLKTKLADTVKTLSDHAVSATLILVGVADSVESLVAEHRSIERALVQVRLPRMSDNEMYGIVDRGLAAAQMTCSLRVKKMIAHLSQGLPHYTHLIGQHSAFSAAGQDRDVVLVEDVHAAVKDAVENVQQTIKGAYHKATMSPRDNLFPQVLLACAFAPVDDLGFFSAADVRKPLASILERSVQISQYGRHLKELCKPSRGSVLTVTGPSRRQRFRFSDPLMEPFVVMRGLKRGFRRWDIEDGYDDVVDGAATSTESADQEPTGL